MAGFESGIKNEEPKLHLVLAEAKWAAYLGGSGVPEKQTPLGSSPPCLWVQLQNGNKNMTSAIFYGASKAFRDYLYLHLMVFKAVRVL